MDGAIERNRVALTHIVAALVAMAGLSERASPTATCLPPTASTLPRHLWLAILRLLRPAEAAARRLIIAAARGLVALPPAASRKPAPTPQTAEPFLRRFGLAVMASPAQIAEAAAAARRSRADREHAAPILPCPEPVEGRGTATRIPAFPLLDPLLRPSSEAHRHVPARAVPRILFPGIAEPFHVPPPPSPDDAVSAAGVARRLAALAAALDDLPGHARRFARWKARLDAGLERRISPLRGGPPPGGRLARYDPDTPGAQDKDRAQRPRREIREIDEILVHAHELAIDALERPDTS